MTRLQSELNRLYFPDAQASTLIAPSGQVRAMVLELACPPSWEPLSKVWYGVQAELGLPAPAIAVSGTDGLQLWFSLAEPIAAAQAHAFLARLRQRFLPDLDARRVRLMPGAEASAQRPERHARLVPAQQQPTGNWSAFVAPDLAPVFDDAPWLDIPPSDDGQAALLQGVGVWPQAAFEAAMAQLDATPPAAAARREPPSAPALPAPVSVAHDAEQFLLQVMRDDTVSMALRIEAAKALLQLPGSPRG